MNQSQEFTAEQKNYLQGFLSGNDMARTMRGLPPLASLASVLGLPAPNGQMSNGQADNGHSQPVEPLPAGPEAIHHSAQNRVLAEGKKLVPEEVAKRKKFPLDSWDDMQQHSEQGRYPKGTDVLAFKYHGLFYVAPAQDSYMCRLRFHGGIMRSDQMRNLADIADQYAGGYADATTRANLQLREIKAENATPLLIALQDAGICSRGSGADNIRNVTGTPTAGIDPQELIDTRPLSKDMHYYILHHREMYGLPRKFNIAFDGGGTISSVADTNDIGFAAVRVGEDKAVPAGIYFRMALGGITGHGDFARDVGVLLKPEQCVPMAAAVVRVFIDNGDRTDRKKARLKYVLDAWGLERYMAEVQKYLNFEPLRLPLAECEPRGPVTKHAHIGVHPQRQPGLFYVGVVLPVGRMSSTQMRGLAAIAERYGSGTLRLTVWQNLLVSDIPEAKIPAVQEELKKLELGWSATSVRSGLIACTGNTGCRFSASNTKKHALEISDFVESRLQLDQPVNIHLTGCPHSCAQHYIGDIGLLGAKVEVEDDMVEGYHIYVGGGYGEEQSIGREVYRDVIAPDAPLVVERMLQAYKEHRLSEAETFYNFTRRYSVEQLTEMFERQVAPVGAQ
ncbi:MAG: NirA family protein [Abitibacteriaceae bacterium]|nr:NirA family protein [Abditibacteriaceae bacterium]